MPAANRLGDEGRGFALARYRVLKRIAWERVAAAVAALAAVFVLADAPGLALLATVVACLVAGLVAETVRIREFRVEVRSGPTQH